jgi:hypothetical protein
MPPSPLAVAAACRLPPPPLAVATVVLAGTAALVATATAQDLRAQWRISARAGG